MNKFFDGELLSGYENSNSDWYKICPRCSNPYGASQFPSKDENDKEIYVCSNCNLIETVYEPQLSKLLQRVSEQNEELANLKAKLTRQEKKIEGYKKSFTLNYIEELQHENRFLKNKNKELENRAKTNTKN